jgi:hypothetical protein
MLRIGHRPRMFYFGVMNEGIMVLKNLINQISPEDFILNDEKIEKLKNYLLLKVTK